MKITEQTTPEQYEAWLASSPTLSQIREAVNVIFKNINHTLLQIQNICVHMAKKLKKKRSCLRPMGTKPAIYPLSYDKNAIGSQNHRINLIFWRSGLRMEINDLHVHYTNLMKIESLEEEIFALTLHSKKREDLLERVKDEIAMERLFSNGLTVLINK